MSDIQRYINPVVQIDHSKWGTGEAVADVMVKSDKGDWVKYSDHQSRIAELEARVNVLAGALVRLRDCDWVISLPDRMDAVRKIASDALTKEVTP